MNKLRDLKADLKLCNKATLGPWQSNKSCGDNHYPNNYVWGEKGPGYGTVAKAGVDYPSIPREHDAEFIAQAREGWPHAIERAIKAEALVRELVHSLKLIRSSSQFSLAPLPGTTWEEITDLVNIAIICAEEVLGDET